MPCQPVVMSVLASSNAYALYSPFLSGASLHSNSVVAMIDTPNLELVTAVFVRESGHGRFKREQRRRCPKDHAKIGCQFSHLKAAYWLGAWVPNDLR